MQLRPGYREWAPPDALRGAVACVWSQVVDGAPGRSVSVLPDACSDLIWHEGDGALVAGPDTAAWDVVLEPGTVLLGVRFLPGAGGPALRLPLDEVRNQRVPIADAVPSLSSALPADLPADQALVRLLTVAARMVGDGPPDGAVQAAARLLADPATRLPALTDHVGISERQLRRRFHESVGYGPKTLQRVLRLRAFVASAATQGDLAGLAAKAGYADQAHLTRECRDLTGVTPAVLAARQWSSPA
ncbi:MAG: DUF6597 domain-containing transcriptional factor [Acidimicrobiales bacterium]